MIFPLEVFDAIDQHLELDMKSALRSTCRALRDFRYTRHSTRGQLQLAIKTAFFEPRFASIPKPRKLGFHYVLRLEPSSIIITRVLSLSEDRPNVGEVGVIEKVMTEDSWYMSFSKEDTKEIQTWYCASAFVEPADVYNFHSVYV